ncbi:hypothetical protein EBZ70_04965, partial [bacterium]|nr:hypothetical protein [bacterium]
LRIELNLYRDGVAQRGVWQIRGEQETQHAERSSLGAAGHSERKKKKARSRVRNHSFLFLNSIAQ